MPNGDRYDNDIDAKMADDPEVERRRLLPEPRGELCGTCNTYPTRWHNMGWTCRKSDRHVSADESACHSWSEREDWKPSPPMYCLLKHKPRSDEPLLAPKPAPKPRKPPPGFVYFAQCGDFLKIGFSTSPRQRISSIQTGTPHEVVLLGKISGDVSVERGLHAQFKRFHHRLEWFHLTPELKQEIAVMLHNARRRPKCSKLAQ